MCFDQPLPPAGIELGQRPLDLAQRLTALGGGLGIDQVGQALGGGQVELAVLEGAAGELAGLGRPTAGNGANRLQHGRHHRPSAVHLQLGHVLAGLATGPGEPQRQPVVEHLPGPRSAHAPVCGKARLRPRRRHMIEHCPGCGPGDSNDRHASPAMAAR